MNDLITVRSRLKIFKEFGLQSLKSGRTMICLRALCMTLHQKMKFCIKDFFSECDQIRRKLRISSHLLKKSLMENFIFFCSVIKTDCLLTYPNWYQIYHIPTTQGEKKMLPNISLGLIRFCYLIFHWLKLTGKNGFTYSKFI